MASVSSITNYTSNTSSADTLSSSQQTLTQNDFLQLLVTQMENQDPLDPQSDTQMAAEMAQFTSLQDSSAMSSSLSMMQANSLLGSTVNLQVPGGSASATPTTTSGVVQGVIMQNGTPQILVNGAAYTLSQVLSVSPTVANPTSSSASTSTP